MVHETVAKKMGLDSLYPLAYILTQRLFCVPFKLTDL